MTDTKGNSVVQRLMEPIVMEEHTRGSINVRMRVLRLAMLREHTRGDLRVLLDKLEDRVSQHIRPGVSKVHEGFKARVRLAPHAVAIGGNHTAGLERVPQVSADVLVSELGANFVLHG